MTSKIKFVLSITVLVMCGAATAFGQTAPARSNSHRSYRSGPLYSAPNSTYYGSSGRNSANYGYDGRDPASRPYNYRGYADQGYAPPERGGQASNF